MPTYIKAKIPWLKIALVTLVIVFVVFAVGMGFPAAGAYMMSAISGALGAVVGFFAAAPYQVAVTACLVGGALILITQRKYFFKEKISNSTMAGASSPLQGGLIQTNPLLNPMSAQAVLPSSEKTEVTTSA
jgi:intracellular septation protein A